jgi:hypothetical protein
MAQAADGDDDDADLPEYLRAAIREDEREREWRAQVRPWWPSAVQPPVCTDTTTQCRC